MTGKEIWQWKQKSEEWDHGIWLMSQGMQGLLECGGKQGAEPRVEDAFYWHLEFSPQTPIVSRNIKL